MARLGLIRFGLTAALLSVLAAGLSIPASGPAAGAGEYRLPWAAGVTWNVTQGLHPTNAWDFQPPGAGSHNDQVLAVAGGTARISCSDSAGQAIVSLATAAGTFQYVHLQTSAVQAAGITSAGVSVQRGQVLGRLHPSPPGSPDPGCGYSLPAGASHLHLRFPSLPFVLDGVTFSSAGPNGGSLTSTNTPGTADRDGDGVPDSSDQCPDEPGPSSTGGCPDADGDDVIDRDDRCASEPGEAAELGCLPQLGMRVDVNRDGRSDVVHRWSQGVNTWLSKGDGTWTVKGFQAHAGYGYGDGVWLTAHVNADGRTDLVHRWSGGVNTWLSRGDGTWTVKGFQAHAGYGYTDGVWLVGDVNRDGRSDLVHRWSQGVNTWLSRGDGSWAVKGFQAHAGYGYRDGVWMTIDVNGDIRTDLVHRWSGGVNTWRSNGDGTWAVTGFAAHAGYGYADGVWRTADINKDGKGDLVHRWRDGVNTWLARPDGSWSVVGFQAHAGYGYEQGTWLTVDQNADGRTDLVHRWQEGVNTWTSKGDGTWTVKGFQAQAGYGYGSGVWPGSACCPAKVVNLVRPTISGTTRVGSTLTAAAGTWTPPSLTYRFAWMRDGVVIPGASARTYRLVTADRGHRISVRVTATRVGFAATARASLATALIRRPA